MQKDVCMQSQNAVQNPQLTEVETDILFPVFSVNKDKIYSRKIRSKKIPGGHKIIKEESIYEVIKVSPDQKKKEC